MQVFKLYLKVLNKNKRSVIMYMAIFISVLFGAIIPNAVSESTPYYEESKCDVAVFDYDKSEISKEVLAYINRKHIVKEIENDKPETIQDELYEMNVDCVVVLDKGLEKGFLEGDCQDKLKIYVIKGTVTARLFEKNINDYLKMLNTYTLAGVNLEDAAAKCQELDELSVDVSLANGNQANEHSGMYYFFIYLVWILAAICIDGISMVLVTLNKKNVQDRIECSSYKFSGRNLEILLGVLATGMGLCIIFVLGAAIAFKGEFLTVKGLLYSCNMVCYCLVVLAITFVASKLTTKPMVISMMANVISLGMSFLSGVFVPMEFLSESVIKIAHFLPSYWYVKVMMIVENYSNDMLGNMFGYMGIQILFAMAIVVVGLIISRNKRSIA